MAVKDLLGLNATVPAASARELNEITGTILGAAITVHDVLGPGLLESVYESCLQVELSSRGMHVERQVYLPLRYRDVLLQEGYRLDLLVGRRVVVEVKAVEKLLPVHEAQILTYLKLTGASVGLLLNFNTSPLRKGIRRVVNGFPSA